MHIRSAIRVIDIGTDDMKTFSIGNDRIPKLEKNDEIRISDKTTKKEAVFTPARWVFFLLCLDEIDNQLCKLFNASQNFSTSLTVPCFVKLK